MLVTPLLARVHPPGQFRRRSGAGDRRVSRPAVPRSWPSSRDFDFVSHIRRCEALSPSNECYPRARPETKPVSRCWCSAAPRQVLRFAAHPTGCAFVLTAALTSLRCGVLVTLRRPDVDLVEGMAFVRRSLLERKGRLEVARPKNNSVRVVTLPGVLIVELRSHFDRVSDNPDVPLFTGERGATPRRGNWRANVGWREAVLAAGLPASISPTCGIRATIWLPSRVHQRESSCNEWATQRCEPP